MNNNFAAFSPTKFDDLFKLAADWDCLHILDFYCEDLFDHDRVGSLNRAEQAMLAEAAELFIFMECASKGYGMNRTEEQEVTHNAV